MAAAVNRDKVVAALAGGKTLSHQEIGETTGLETRALSNVIFNMTKAGALLRTGERGSYDYALSDGMPPPKGAGKKVKTAPAGATGAKAKKKYPAAPAARNGHDEAAEPETDFAVTARGSLSIKQGDLAIILGPQAFTQLREFINATGLIWDPDQQ